MTCRRTDLADEGSFAILAAVRLKGVVLAVHHLLCYLPIHEKTRGALLMENVSYGLGK